MGQILYKELGYEIAGAAIAVRKSLGLGHKELIYQRALAEELDLRKIKYSREASIKIYSPQSGKLLGIYRPDFLVKNLIVVELKALPRLTKPVWDQVYQYLRNSPYELAYLINFAPDKMEIKRVIHTKR